MMPGEERQERSMELLSRSRGDTGAEHYDLGLLSFRAVRADSSPASVSQFAVAEQSWNAVNRQLPGVM